MPDIDAVLFDFAGTLAVPRTAVDLVAAAAEALGREPDAAGMERVARAMLEAGIPGGPYPDAVPDDLRAAYEARDLSADGHRRAYVGLLGTAVPGDPDLAAAVYERILGPEGWVPYADAAPTVAALERAGVRTGLCSNVAFDARRVLRAHGLAAVTERATLSYEEGATKPDPALFRAALERLGTAPERTLMVGDHPTADGGAADVGMPVLILPMTPPGTTHGLGAVLEVAGVG